MDKRVVIAGADVAGFAERVNELAARVGILTDDPIELMDVATESLNTAAVAFCRAGLAFLKIQEQRSLGNFGQGSSVSARTDTDTAGGFIAFVEAHGIPKQRVYEAIAAAKFVMRLSSADVDRALAVGKKKLKLLAGLPQEAIEEAAEAGYDMFAEAEVLSYAELKTQLKQFKVREANYDAELERMSLKVKRLEKAREPLSPFLARTEDIRAECLWHQEEGEANLNSLRKLFEDINIEPNGPEWRYQIEQVWVTMNFVAAQAAGLVHACREMCAVDDLPLAIESQHMMTALEAARWLEDAEAVKSQYAGRKAARELLRQKTQEAAGIKKRGRPVVDRGA